jgi:hypothetical protein
VLSVPVRRIAAEWLDPALPTPVDGVLFLAEDAVTGIARDRLERTDVCYPAGFTDEGRRTSDHRMFGIG